MCSLLSYQAIPFWEFKKKKKVFSVNVLDSELDACDTWLSEVIRKRRRQYGARQCIEKRNRMIKWRGSLHSPALTEARSSWKPRAHLCSHLGRPNQNQIISFFPPSLPLSFAPERINYSYSKGNQEVPVSFEQQQQQCFKVVFYWISEPKKSPKKMGLTHD